jgi:hypothetical protein
MQEQVLVITADGRIRFVWDDDLAALCEHGRPTITRAGDVEPTSDGSGWTADCRRIGGGVYGPYPLRQTALEHERAVVVGRLVAGLI